MHVGKLRHKIEIEERIAEQDRTGAPTESWVTWRNVWASISPLNGRMQLQAEQVSSEITHRIYVRALDVTGIDTTYRIRYTEGRTGDERTFDIESVINLHEQDRIVELMCVERVEDDT